MDVTQMRMLLALSESGSMTVTAKKLRLSQPALTYRINNIEAELGFKVFNRSHAGTTLTREGEYLCKRLQTVVVEYEESVRLARALSSEGSQYNLRIGTNDMSRDAVSLYLRICMGSNPDLSYTMVPCGKSDVVELLQSGVIDLWSCSDAYSCLPLSADLHFTELFSAHETVHLSANHPLASKECIAISDLEGQTVWIWRYGKASTQTDAIRREIERRQIGVDIEEFIPDVPPMLSVLSSGNIAIYDDGFVSPAPRHVLSRPLLWPESDKIGFACLKSRKEELADVLEQMKRLFAGYDPGIPDSSFTQIGRTMAILDDIAATVVRGGMKDVEPLVQSALDLGLPAQAVLDRGLLAGMYAIGADFKDGDAYTPEMLAAVDTMNKGTEFLRPLLEAEKDSLPRGHAVIGTVKGDRHDIGKNMVRFMLESKGMDVTDLGMGVSPDAFAKCVVEDEQCNLVLISVFYSEALVNVERTIQALEEAHVRDRVFVMLGGSAADAQVAQQLGADAYTADAVSAAQKAMELLSW